MTGSRGISHTRKLYTPKSEQDNPLVGKLGNKEMTLSEAKSWFLNFSSSSALSKQVSGPSDKSTDKDFCLLANGFWQSEGYIGGIFRSGVNFYPICTGTQYLSEESAIFFLRLQNALQNKGSFSITLNKHGKFIIVYRLSGWDTFFSVFTPYFYMLYGAKFQAVKKLEKIYKLSCLIKNSGACSLNSENGDKNKVLLIKLAYSLTAHSARYKVSIQDKLLSLNLDPALLTIVQIPDSILSENNISPSFLFILGFFLGDGNLHLKLEWKISNSTIVIIPVFSIAQSNVESNTHVMEIMTTTLNNMGLKASLLNKNTSALWALNLQLKGLIMFLVLYLNY